MATDCSSEPALDARWKQSFRRRLLTWYDRHQRDLPWRRSQNPYRVWVSEVMLQQTQVETVKPYFRKFIKAFPSVKRLAAASEQDVLRLWEGLGYYRRARQLHAAAKIIVAEHGGHFPRDVNTLQTLPGIGRYTAGAIASIAFDERVPILETNTIRLLSRLIGYPDDPTKSAGQRLLWQTAEDVLPRKNIALFNQALMELGSLVCTPGSPQCEQCPVAKLCTAYADGSQSAIPRTGRKVNFISVAEAAVLINKQGKLLLRQCPEGQRWAGLWDFPRFEIVGEAPQFVHDELTKKVKEQIGLVVDPKELVKTIKHGVTRHRITLDCYTARYISGRISRRHGTALRWVRPAELGAFPLNSTGRQLANLAHLSMQNGS